MHAPSSTWYFWREGRQWQALAGISVAGPAFSLDDIILPFVIAAVRDAARVISQRLSDLEM